MAEAPSTVEDLSSVSAAGSETPSATPSATEATTTATSSSSGITSSTEELLSETPRMIGRWFIGETLGKGGYSWVKKGYDKKTSRCVALKFMAKAGSEWRSEQERQVVTEIESLKKVRHRHVMKLYAYNMSAKYPQRDGTELDTVLLVLEYAPGGELFDIVYYTSHLESVIVRTYFLQFLSGLQACHSAGICHRDLKPQNLLLDNKFNLKITDFGLSKVFYSDSDVVMRTTYVGTRGYQAPELLLKRPFGVSCDIFSAGVILFILLTGYPPFEQAVKTDRWYRPIAKNDFNKFWDAHHASPIAKDENVKLLIFSMLIYDPKKRATLEDVMKHPWLTEGKSLEGKNLIRVLRLRHKKMEAARKADTKKMSDLQTSVERSRAIKGIELMKFEPLIYPANEKEGLWDIYTVMPWRTVLNVIHDQIALVGGASDFDYQTAQLICSLKLVDISEDTSTSGSGSSSSVVSSAKVSVRDAVGTPAPSSDFTTTMETDSGKGGGGSDTTTTTMKKSPEKVAFSVNVYRSRLYQSRMKDEVIYAVQLRRLSGSVVDYRKIVHSVIYKLSAGVLTGLPDRVKVISKDEERGLYDGEDETSEDGVTVIDSDVEDAESEALLRDLDEYSAMIAAEGF